MLCQPPISPVVQKIFTIYSILYGPKPNQNRAGIVAVKCGTVRSPVVRSITLFCIVNGKAFGLMIRWQCL